MNQAETAGSSEKESPRAGRREDAQDQKKVAQPSQKETLASKPETESAIDGRRADDKSINSRVYRVNASNGGKGGTNQITKLKKKKQSKVLREGQGVQKGHLRYQRGGAVTMGKREKLIPKFEDM